MAFGAFIDVPLVVIAFILTTFYRKQIAYFVKKIKLPTIILSLLVAFLLIIFEEQINCMPAWCLKVLIPPTLPFLFVQVFIVLILVKLLHTKRVFVPTLLYVIFGISFEFIIGASSKGLQTLGPIQQLFFILYIGISYAIIIVLPLAILQNGK